MKTSPRIAMRRFLSLIVILVTLPLQATAQRADVATLFDVMRIDEMLAVMSEEGIGFGGDIQRDMFPQNNDPAWMEEVRAIYDPSRLQEIFAEGFGDDPSPAMVGRITAFFQSDLGQRLTEAELVARKEFLKPGLEEAAMQAGLDLRAAGGARLALLTKFVTVNDLVSENVVGGLNSNLAFFRGMNTGGAFGEAIPEEELLRDVWAQEPDLRADTEDWVYGFVLAAYGGFSDDEIKAYIDISASDAGQAFNRHLFAAFDALFDDVSFALGFAAAKYVSGEDI